MYIIFESFCYRFQGIASRTVSCNFFCNQVLYLFIACKVWLFVQTSVVMFPEPCIIRVKCISRLAANSISY